MPPRERSRALPSILLGGALAAALAVAVALPSAPAPAETATSPSSTHSATPSTTASDPGPAATGIGDPYFPDHGNAGYDATSYDVALAWDDGEITGTSTMKATATTALSSFALDLRLRARSVTVDGKRAKFEQTGEQDLVITPTRPIAKGATMTVRVTYGDRTSEPLRPHPDENPWYRTPTGELLLGQPHAAAWWFPANDHPRDRATMSVRLTVPKGLTAISNGRLTKTTSSEDTTTWQWAARDAMAPYLAFVAIGKYRVTEGEGKDGLPWLNAVEEGVTGAAATGLVKTPDVVAWLEDWIGPYPFEVTGGVVPDMRAGFALETQTRPVYDPVFWGVGENNEILVHELAHQWFGDSITVHSWADIWINEGFATYAEWKWAEDQDRLTTEQSLARSWSVPSPSTFWQLTIGDPGPERIFDRAVYERGAMTLAALRRKVGDQTFERIVRTWAKERAGDTATDDAFREHAAKVSGKDLDDFFTIWLDTPQRPEPTEAAGLEGIERVPYPGSPPYGPEQDGDSN